LALVLGDGGQGIAFIVAFGVVMEIVAAFCSSPQTTEINIGKRGKTLMKWVHMGQAVSVVLIIIAAAIDAKHRTAILAGGVAAMVTVEGMYMHAKQAGLANGGAETEEY
jgi:hypothetical protein